MVPTLHPGSHYLLNRTAYRQSPPQRGDVVVIHDPGDHGFSVKRIIALEGETVHFLNGKVYVNTEPLSEPYLLPGTFTFTYSQAKEQLITCGKDQCLVPRRQPPRQRGQPFLWPSFTRGHPRPGRSSPVISRSANAPTPARRAMHRPAGFFCDLDLFVPVLESFRNGSSRMS